MEKFSIANAVSSPLSKGSKILYLSVILSLALLLLSLFLGEEHTLHLSTISVFSASLFSVIKILEDGKGSSKVALLTLILFLLLYFGQLPLRHDYVNAQSVFSQLVLLLPVFLWQIGGTINGLGRLIAGFSGGRSLAVDERKLESMHRSFIYLSSLLVLSVLAFALRFISVGETYYPFFLFLSFFTVLSARPFWKKTSWNTFKGRILNKISSGQDLAAVYEKMKRYLDDNKPYLDENFAIDKLAMALCTNKGYLSKIINNFSGMNFCQLMNSYRVKYSVELFKNNKNLKVAELAELSGFKSGVTFNMAFKLFMKTTPGEWCRAYREDLL